MKMNSEVFPSAAIEFLMAASHTMRERADQYDKPEGERSMKAIISAFNAITGRSLTESEGWLIMLLLKMVRQWQNPDKAHPDSLLDGVAYASLLAESFMCSTPSGTTHSGTGD